MPFPPARVLNALGDLSPGPGKDDLIRRLGVPDGDGIKLINKISDSQLDELQFRKLVGDLEIHGLDTGIKKAFEDVPYNAAINKAIDGPGGILNDFDLQNRVDLAVFKPTSTTKINGKSALDIQNELLVGEGALLSDPVGLRQETKGFLARAKSALDNSPKLKTIGKFGVLGLALYYIISGAIDGEGPIEALANALDDVLEETGKLMGHAAATILDIVSDSLGGFLQPLLISAGVIAGLAVIGVVVWQVLKKQKEKRQRRELLEAASSGRR